MRGDPPETIYDALAYLESTPHARGSTQVGWEFQVWNGVYPACAGIHPHLKNDNLNLLRLPRMRGDPPRQEAWGKAICWSTPHARGSTG